MRFVPGRGKAGGLVGVGVLPATIVVSRALWSATVATGGVVAACSTVSSALAGVACLADGCSMSCFIFFVGSRRERTVTSVLGSLLDGRLGYHSGDCVVCCVEQSMWFSDQVGGAESCGGIYLPL